LRVLAVLWYLIRTHREIANGAWYLTLKDTRLSNRRNIGFTALNG
jgi:hypothetical protein